MTQPLPAFPCRDCAQSCCAEFTIFLTPFDLRRIAGPLELEVGKLAAMVPLTRAHRDYSPYAFSLGSRRRFLLTLKRRRTGCLFLLRIGTLGRCGIHALRPRMCRCYPYSAEDGEIREVAQSRCPPDKHLTPGDRQEIRSAFAAMTGEFLIYREFLDLWHSRELPRLRAARRPDSPGMFAAFLACMEREMGVIPETATP